MIRVADIEPALFEEFIRTKGVGQWFGEAGDGSDFELPDVPGSIYGAAIGPETLVVFAAQPFNSAAMHLHVAADPAACKQTVLAVRECVRYVRSIVGRETTLFTFTPADNEPAQAMNKLLGFRHVGTLHRAFLRGVQRVDMEIYEDA